MWLSKTLFVQQQSDSTDYEGSYRADATEYAFSERRACRLMTMPVSSYRYETTRSDEPLRTQLVELARQKPRFGSRRLHVFVSELIKSCWHKRPRATPELGPERTCEDTIQVTMCLSQRPNFGASANVELSAIQTLRRLQMIRIEPSYWAKW